MKKFFALFLVIAILFCGCGGGAKTESQAITLATAQTFAEKFLTDQGMTGYTYSGARYYYEPGAKDGTPLVEFSKDGTSEMIGVLVKSETDVKLLNDGGQTATDDPNAAVKTEWMGNYMNAEGFLMVISDDSLDSLGFMVTSSFKYTSINAYGMPTAGNPVYEFEVDGSHFKLTKTETGIEFFTESEAYVGYNGLYTKQA